MTFRNDFRFRLMTVARVGNARCEKWVWVEDEEHNGECRIVAMDGETYFDSQAEAQHAFERHNSIGPC